MFRTWSKFDNSVPIEDINAIVPKVSCGDKISIQIGCKGESTLAWKQILEIK
jgi:hypothetical protein